MPFQISWKMIFVALLLLAVAGLFSYVTILRLQIENLTTENKHLTDKFSNCQEDNKNLQTRLKEQNAEVTKFKNEADRRLREREIELEKAKKESNYLRNRAQGLISIVPDPGEDICKAANDLINEEIRRNAN